MGKYNDVLVAAVACDICDPWAKMIEAASSMDELMEMYVKGIDFCLDNNFPSNEMLCSQVGVDILEKYGVFINRNVSLENKSFIVYLGYTSGTISSDGYSTGQMYVKHDSCLNAIVKDNAFLVIDAFDKSSINIQSSGNSKVLINLYGKATQTHTMADNAIVKVVNKNKDRY